MIIQEKNGTEKNSKAFNEKSFGLLKVKMETQYYSK